MSEILRPYIPETWAKYATPARVKTGTLTGLRISSVDGTAFVDNAAAITTYADGNHMLDILDSSGRLLRGILSAVGTGETLGSELVTNGDFAVSTGWVAEAGWVIDSGVLTGTNTTKQTYRSVSAVPVGSLYQAAFTVSSYSAGNVRAYLTSDKDASLPQAVSANGAAAIYITRVGTGGSFYIDMGSAAFTGVIDDASCKLVTAPSTDGALIVSAKGGSTRNFSSKDASFTYNESSYAYRVWRVS